MERKRNNCTEYTLNSSAMKPEDFDAIESNARMWNAVFPAAIEAYKSYLFLVTDEQYPYVFDDFEKGVRERIKTKKQLELFIGTARLHCIEVLDLPKDTDVNVFELTTATAKMLLQPTEANIFATNEAVTNAYKFLDIQSRTALYNKMQELTAVYV